MQEEKQKHSTIYSQARALDNIRQCVTCSHKCNHWQRTEDGTRSHKLSNWSSPWELWSFGLRFSRRLLNGYSEKVSGSGTWRNCRCRTHSRCSDVSGWWGTRGRVLSSSMRYSVINEAVFFPLLEHSKFRETNQKAGMINCMVYNESCSVCLWIPLLCRTDMPDAEKHWAMTNL